MPATHVDYQLSQLSQLEAESIHIFRKVAARFEKPMQYVVRAKSERHHDDSGYNQVTSSVMKPAEQVAVLTSGLTSAIQGVDSFDKEVEGAFPSMSVTVRHEDGVSRSDMVARVKNAPQPARCIDATLFSKVKEPLNAAGNLL